MFQRDLLTDSKLEGTFGGGTARFAAATAAAAERVAAAKAPNFSSRSASAEAAEGVSRDAPRGDAELVTEEQEDDDSRRLAGFLLSVLKGLGDADKEVQVKTNVRRRLMRRLEEIVMLWRSRANVCLREAYDTSRLRCMFCRHLCNRSQNVLALLDDLLAQDASAYSDGGPQTLRGD